jgi:hypothetical protein
MSYTLPVLGRSTAALAAVHIGNVDNVGLVCAGRNDNNSNTDLPDAV